MHLFRSTPPRGTRTAPFQRDKRDIDVTVFALPPVLPWLQIFFKEQKAYVHYPDDDTYEELDLRELLALKHIAISWVKQGERGWRWAL